MTPDEEPGLGLLPAGDEGPFGPIVQIDFPHPDGRPGGGKGYSIGIDGFLSSIAGGHEANPDLLRDREPLELWIWTLQAWRLCRFRGPALGHHNPRLEVDVHDTGDRDLRIGSAVKRLDPRDLFRVPR